MSGIINSAGSRSGIIGTTELEIEEGVWEATLSGASAPPDSEIKETGQYYRKQGKRVSIRFQFANVDTTGASGGMKVTGLPFASLGTNFDGNFQGYGLDFDPDHIISMRIEDSTVWWTLTRDQTTWGTLQIFENNSTYLYGSMTYDIA